MSDRVKKSIFVQGSILAVAGIISKIIGFIYRIPMANLLGNSGNGLYSISFGIYNVALTLSSYSMPLAVSKLMSERIAKKEYKNGHFLFRKALLFALVMGTISCTVLFAGAGVFARIYNTEGLERPLRILAPTTFIVAILGTCRGYYQGHRNMVPTAFSQIIEQIANAIVSVVGAIVCVRMCDVEGAEGSFGAMGGTMGTLAGATVALVVFGILFFFDRKRIAAEKKLDDKLTENDDIVYKAIILTVLPVIKSQTIYQLGYTLDDFFFSNIMHMKNFASESISSMQGVFNTQYNQMVNLPTAIATSMAAATLPSIVASFTLKKFDEVHKKINLVIKINMLIAIPSSVGLAVLAEPIMTVLFPGLKEYHSMAVLLLQTGSGAVVFYALSTLTTSILQGCDQMRQPATNSAISLFAHVVIVAVLVYFTDLGVYGLVIGNVSFPLMTSALNVYFVKKLLNYKFDIKGTFIKPFLSSAVMGIVTFAVYKCFINMLPAGKLTVVLAMLIAMVSALVSYVVTLIALKTFTKEEVSSMPIIKKFVKK